MSLFSVFSVAASGMTAQSQRLNTVASNIANAESASGPDGKAYRARQVVFSAHTTGEDWSGEGFAEGVYTCLVRYIDQKGLEQYKAGRITLIR